MSGIFLKILNMSIAAGVVVLVVVLTRALLRRAPKWLRCALWVLVAVRLVVPVLPQSSVSLVPSAEPIVVKQAEQSATEPAGQSAANPADRSAADPSGQTGVAPNTSNFNDSGVATDNQSQPIEHPAAEDRSKSSFLDVAGYIWLAGLVVMAAYAAASYTKLRRKVSASVSKTSDPGHGRTFICDDIASPFILGVFKPRIYLPSGLSAADEAHVLAHEDAHLLRRDQIWKPLGYLLLSVYWFNPLMWLAYILFCRDIELACDEKVVKDLTEQDRAAYSRALLSCSISRSAITACPLAFGEVDVKSRVKSALSYKKPAFWVIVVAVVICIVLAVCFLTNPKEEKAVQGKVTNWFEYDTYGEGMGPVVTLEEYPGMEFRAEGSSVYVIKDGKDEILTKYPAKNAFFCDLDGDGKREICTTCLLGSGIVDSRVVVYVLSDGSTLELSDRGNFDYTLAMRDGKLIVMKRAYDETSSVGADGLLVLRDGRLEMAKLDGELIKSPSSPPELTVVSDQGSTEVKHSGSAWQKGSSIGAGISITTEDSPGLGNDTFRKGLQVVTTENGKIRLSFGSDPDSVTAEFIDETVLMQMGESSAVEVGIAGDRSFNAPRGENYCIVHAKWEVRSGTGGDAWYYFKVVNNYKESRTIIEDLQNLYPGYFTLDVRDGLTVYGSSDSGFGFLPGWNSDLDKYSYESRQQLRPMQLSEAKQIISWYKTNKGLEDSRVILKPFQDPEATVAESSSFPETLSAMFDDRFKLGDWLKVDGSDHRPAGSDPILIDSMQIYDVFLINSPDQGKARVDFALEEFPEKGFYVTDKGVFSVDKRSQMIEGTIESLYAADVTGDGIRDLCAVRHVVKSVDRDHRFMIGVYDIANNRDYKLEEWGANQYFLFEHSGELCLGRYNEKQVAVAAAGPVAVKDGVITLEEDANCISVATKYFEHSVAAVNIFGYDRSIDTLRDLYPHYFSFDASDGLTVFANALGGYSKEYGILAGKSGRMELDEYFSYFRTYNSSGSLTPVEIETILNSYGLPDEQIVFRPLYDPMDTYRSKDETTENVRACGYLNTRLKKYRFGDLLQIKTKDGPADPNQSITEYLQEIYPEYFSLDVSEGITAYYSDFGGGGLISGWDSYLPAEQWAERSKQRHLSINELQVILAWHQGYHGPGTMVPEGRIMIKPFQDPLSSNIEGDALVEKLEALLGSTYTIGGWLHITDSDTQGTIQIDSHRYSILSSPIQTLPKAYQFAGTLSAEQAEQTQPYENLTIEKAKELISRGASVTWEDLNKYRYIYTMNLTSKEPKEAYFDIDGRTSFMVSGEIGKTITRMRLVTDSGETLLWVAER